MSNIIIWTRTWRQANIMKMVESHPELTPHRVRGGYLKIQGTWMPYKVCLLLLSARPFVHSTADCTLFSPQVCVLHWITACSVLWPFRQGLHGQSAKFTVLNSMVYLLWWNKPPNVQCPKCVIAKLEKEVGTKEGDSGSRRGRCHYRCSSGGSHMATRIGIR